MPNLSYQDYSILLQFAFDEELERTREFLEALEHPEDDSTDDKHWLAEPEVIPSLEELSKAVATCGVDLETLKQHAREREEGEGDEDSQDDSYTAIRQAWMGLP